MQGSWKMSLLGSFSLGNEVFFCFEVFMIIGSMQLARGKYVRFLDPNSVIQAFVTFDCPDPACLKWTRSYRRMETHIVSGKHVYQPKKLSILDNAAHIYKNRLDNVNYQSFSPVTSVSSVPFSSNTTISHMMALRQGWVLPTAKPSTRFTKEQIGFLVNKFNEERRLAISGVPPLLLLW